MSENEPAGHGPDASPTREDDAQAADELGAALLAALNPKREVDSIKLRRDAAVIDPRDEGAVASVAPTRESQTDDEFEALIAAAFETHSEETTVPDEGQAAKSAGQDGVALTAARSRPASFQDTAYASVKVDVADAQAKIAPTDSALPASVCDDADDPRIGADYQTVEEFVEALHELFPEVHPIPGNKRPGTVDGPPIRVTSRLRNTLDAACDAEATQGEQKRKTGRRGLGRRKRVTNALRGVVAKDSRSLAADENLAELNRLFDEAITTRDAGRIEATHDAFRKGIDRREDFHLAHLASIAERIERCGDYGAFACGSYWCQNCKNRYGAHLLEDTQAQLTQRYGVDPERWRGHILHGTILDDVVIPDPEIDRDLLATFFASTIRRDHREILGHLGRLQADRRSALSARLSKRGLTTELVKDWVEVGDRDRSFYDPKNAVTDAARLLQLNDVIITARARFKPRSKRPDLESHALISWRDKERIEAYMWQLRKAQPLDSDDIIAIMHDLQFVDREFRGITKTNYPERLKFKSSIEKVIKRERSKLYRLSKDLPGVSLIGVFELELVDLRHAIGGDHQHSVKAKTVRVLASQERKPIKYRKSDEPISFETQRRRAKTSFKNRLLDDARERIATNRELPEVDFHGLQYAVLLHMHVVIDLNGTSRDDLERWLTGKVVGSRRFTGQWPLPYQVMIKSLFENKSVDDSLRHISFYPIKGPLTFNYENIAPKDDEELPEGDPRQFTDEALALIAWLQHGIGHESLRVAVNWPGVDREKRGRKSARPVTPKITDDELIEALAAQGVSLPKPPAGQTDISFLFAESAEGAQAEVRVEASTPPEGHADAQGSTDPSDGTPADRGGEAEPLNDTAASPPDE